MLHAVFAARTHDERHEKRVQEEIEAAQQREHERLIGNERRCVVRQQQRLRVTAASSANTRTRCKKKSEQRKLTVLFSHWYLSMANPMPSAMAAIMPVETIACTDMLTRAGIRIFI